MIERETVKFGTVEVNATEEIVFPSINGMSTTIPIGNHWKKIIVQTSGGLDSALMLYLFAKVLKQKKSEIKIIPLSLEIPTKAKNLSSARAVVKKVKELTQYEHLLPCREVIMPMDHALPPKKDQFFNDTIVKIMEDEDVDFEFNGNTKNPPESVRKSFLNDDYRQMERDARTTIYNARFSASPHAMNDKSGIVYLYKKEGILEELAPLTLSCDMNLSEIEERKLDVPCGECWWCRERQWGFEANET